MEYQPTVVNAPMSLEKNSQTLKASASVIGIPLVIDSHVTLPLSSADRSAVTTQGIISQPRRRPFHRYGAPVGHALSRRKTLVQERRDCTNSASLAPLNVIGSPGTDPFDVLPGGRFDDGVLVHHCETSITTRAVVSNG
jgi:hypothetical protein